MSKKCNHQWVLSSFTVGTLKGFRCTKCSDLGIVCSECSGTQNIKGNPCKYCQGGVIEFRVKLRGPAAYLAQCWGWGGSVVFVTDAAEPAFPLVIDHTSPNSSKFSTVHVFDPFEPSVQNDTHRFQISSMPQPHMPGEKVMAQNFDGKPLCWWCSSSPVLVSRVFTSSGLGKHTQFSVKCRRSQCKVRPQTQWCPSVLEAIRAWTDQIPQPESELHAAALNVVQMHDKNTMVLGPGDSKSIERLRQALNLDSERQGE